MNIEKDLSLLVTRLEKLERQNRFFKILGVMILLAAGAALFMGARPLDVLQAERFVLVDSSGQAMATLGPDVTSFSETGLTQGRERSGARFF